MIREQWYAVLEADEIPRNKPLGVTRMGEKLVFWRDAQGKVSCLRDLCPHRGVRLSTGKVLNDRLECPFHGFQFDQGGQCTLVPCNGRNKPISKEMRTLSYPVREAHGFIFIWWGEAKPEAQAALPGPRFFENIDDGFSCGRAHEVWNTHYSRAIENQLDVAHLPFVHGSTIGRGGRTLVDGPLTEWCDQDRFNLYVYNRVDDGTEPRKPKELSRPTDTDFHIEFIFPNLWQNYLGESSRIVVAFTPIDDEHTMMYLHYYQKVVRLPVLSSIFNRLAMPANLFILHQDRGPVATQEPKRSFLKMGEKLVQADRPIVEYRARREELIAAARQTDQ